MGTGNRIAQEAQLLAEERWLVNALKSIRTQRNCLQIERLQLESTLAQYKINQSPRDSRASRYDATPAQSIPETVTEDSQSQLVSICNIMSTTAESRVRELDDGVCNFEELNLAVTEPVFNLITPLDLNVEFEEDDSEDDFEENEDEDNMEIDMNMFMNADCSSGSDKR